MGRERNKPKKSWLEIAREEVANLEEFTIEQAYEVGKIRGKKELIDKACRWLKARNVLTEASLEGFKKAMEEEK